MNKIKEFKKTKTVYKPEIINVSEFETTDGRLFDKLEEANKHQEKIDSKEVLKNKFKITNTIIDLYDYDGIEEKEMIFLTDDFINLSEEDKEDFFKLYPIIKYFEKEKSLLKGWNLLIITYYESCGLSDYSGYNVYIHDINTIKKDIEEKYSTNINEINKFNNELNNIISFSDDKSKIIEKINSLINEYDIFTKNVSPKNWRSTGHHFTELKKIKEDIENFSEITEKEKNNEYVKKNLNL